MHQCLVKINTKRLFPLDLAFWPLSCWLWCAGLAKEMSPEPAHRLQSELWIVTKQAQNIVDSVKHLKICFASRFAKIIVFE